MRAFVLPLFIAGMVANATSATAQNMAASEIDVSDDPIVIAALSKNSTPSGVTFRDKKLDTSSANWFSGDLETANIVFASAPLEQSSYSWRGRREAFLGNYGEAIKIFTEGMVLFPDSYALYRFRGVNLVRNYQFEQGISDLRRAEQLIESVDVSPTQEGIPGRSNYSPSTFKRNIYFYLGQSSMATGDYDSVISYMDKAAAANLLRDKDDFLVSTSFYKYMALRKLGRDEEARQMINAVPTDLAIISNFDYYDAVGFLQGRISRAEYMRGADSLGLYAIGMVDLLAGDTASAKEIFTVVSNNNHKGYWLAEVELLKL